MNLPDLRALQQGDQDAWDAAFDWLWPTAFAVAQLKLAPHLPEEVEDVAIEALEELVDKVRDVKSVEELKPLVASIAHHRAVSLLRERFAKKRGEGKTESLDAPTGGEGDCPEPATVTSPLDSLAEKEMAERLHRTLAALKPPQGGVLADFFLRGLRYEEIATKHGIAVGSVGVYLKGVWTLCGAFGADAEKVERNGPGFAMNPMNDERFFDLAMKVIACQPSDAERAEFEALLSRQPELKAQFEQLQADVCVAKEALPLVNAVEATAGELPGYARARLSAKVRQTLRPVAAGVESEAEKVAFLGWGWWLGLGLAATAALVLVIALLPTSSPKAQVQLALLDLAGATRGGSNESVATLSGTWQGAAVAEFSGAAQLADWENTWPPQTTRPVVKVIYDRTAAEVRVQGRWRDVSFAKKFPVERDLASVLQEVKRYVSEQTRR